MGGGSHNGSVSATVWYNDFHRVCVLVSEPLSAYANAEIVPRIIYIIIRCKRKMIVVAELTDEFTDGRTWYHCSQGGTEKK